MLLSEVNATTPAGKNALKKWIGFNFVSVKQQEEYGFRTNTLEAHGLSKVRDAGDDAEQQQRNHQCGNCVGPDGTHRADIISVAVESDSQNDTECRCKQHACGETRVFLTFEKRQDDEQDRGYAEGDPIICDV